MATLLDQDFLSSLSDDIRANRLPLPAMPDVAVKVGRYVNDEHMDVGQLAKLLSADPILAGRILQIANSPFFRGLNPVETVQAAISRLGAVCVRNLVTSIVVAQMFDKAGADLIRPQLQAAWQHATRVAAHSYVLARKLTRLSADEALLAGLLHNIGVLPMLARAIREPALLDDPAAFDEAVEQMHTRVGALVLQMWEFSDNFISVVTEHEDLLREPEDGPDLVDVVMVANLHCRLGSSHRLAKVPWSGVPAFQRLGLTPELSLNAIREARGEIEELQRLLRG